MVPGFMKLSQDDQIVLLKAGSFEIAVIRMSRYLDLTQNAVLYVEEKTQDEIMMNMPREETLLPQEVFYTSDTNEMKLVSYVFEVAKSIAELKLSEKEIALYSACVLLRPDRPCLKDADTIRCLQQAVYRVLKIELDRNHILPIKGDVTVCDAVIAKMSNLREVSALHMDALSKFKRTATELKFPELHQELFSFPVSPPPADLLHNTNINITI